MFWPALFEVERKYRDSLSDNLPKLSTKSQVSAVSSLYDLMAEAVESKDKRSDDGIQAKSFLLMIKQWTQAQTGELAFPKEMLEELVTIVLASPAVCLMRAIRSLFTSRSGELLRPVSRLCFQELRTYFNKGYVHEIIGRHRRSGRYADQVLTYCFDAHFQEVIDEYSYLIRRVLQRGDVTKFLEHLGRVLSIGPGTPNINVPAGRSGRIKEKRSQRPVNFALAFGEETQAQETGESRASRKTSVRDDVYRTGRPRLPPLLPRRHALEPPFQSGGS